VFDARDLEGHDVAKVTVTLDGQPFATTLDGQALPVDPGEHTFTFQLADSAPVTKTYVLKVGQKERREPVVVVGQSTAAQPSGAAEESPATAGGSESAAPPVPGRAQRLVGLGVGAAGILGLGIGTVLGALAVADWSNATSACPRPGPCAAYKEGQADRDDALAAATGSTVAFVAGGVLLAGGAAIYFTAPKAAPASALRLAPEVGPGVARMTLRGTF
jgi:serine/threonine-protein kinase